MIRCQTEVSQDPLFVAYSIIWFTIYSRLNSSNFLHLRCDTFAIFCSNPSIDSVTIAQTRSYRCAPTRRVEQPQRFRLVIVANATGQLLRSRMDRGAAENGREPTTSPVSAVVCESVRRYRPKYCAPCENPELRCCVPVKTKVTRVTFRCSDGRMVQHNFEWIKRCACNPAYCKYLQFKP